MKIQPYVEKLHTSKEFSKFKQRYGDAYLVAGFFVLDYETGENLHQIDYFIPSQKKVAAFTVDEGVTVQILDTRNDTIPEKLDLQTNVDLDAIKGILEDEMKNRNMTEELKKIIAVVQTMEGRRIWILNCILSGMEILKAHVDDISQTVLKMEKASVLEYVKKMPMQQVEREPTSEDIDKQLEQLDKLKDALKKEKLSLGKKK